MSQEYTEDKVVRLKKLTGYQRLVEAFWLIIALIAAYVMVALLSFDPADPGWSQTAWHSPVHNRAGSFGAWIADVLLFVFGAIAYALPPFVIILCWKVFKQQANDRHIDYFMLALRIIGLLALVLSSCALATRNLDDLYRFASGGLVGDLLNSVMVASLNHVGTTLILLCIWAVGFTLLTGWSWLVICEKIGWLVMSCLTLITNSVRSEPVRREKTIEHYNHPLSQQNNNADRDTFTSTSSAKNDNHIPADEDDALFFAASIYADQEPLINPELYNEASEDQLTLNLLVAEEKPIVLTDSADDPYCADPALMSEVMPNLPLEPTIKPAPTIVIRQPFNTNNLLSGSVLPNGSTLANDRLSNDIAPFETLPLVPIAKVSQTMTSASGTTVTAKEVATEVARRQPAGIQIKPIGVPELPKPNPVRIPTRRELMAYGIKLPSQRQVEELERECAERGPTSAESSADENRFGGDEAMQEEALRQAFIQQQQQRYSATDLLDESSDDGQLISYQPTADTVAENEVPREAIQTTATPAMPAPSRVDIIHDAYEQDEEESEQQDPNMASLIHPFLMRHERPLERPTTPLPTLDLLTSPPETTGPIDIEALENTARLVEERLADYRVKADVVEILPGPVITLYELDLAPGVKASRISNLSRDLARSLSAVAVRIVEVIPGRPYVGLELPNKHRQTVYLREVLDCDRFRNISSPLAIVLGKDISGEPVVADLAKMPHVLVAGTTGSGKSVGVNAMIISMLYKATPEEVRFIMIDPKMLELSVYEGIPHLLTEVVTDMKDAANALRWCVNEMERRYKLMSALGVRNLAGYNDKIKQAEEMRRPIPDPFWKPNESMQLSPPMLEKLPYIVVIVDEFADLMMAVGKKVEELIARLAQKARAAGIHLVLATQRPSVDVITGLIKANIPTRIAFTVSSKIDSRTILDQAGAESLLGMGDMLYLPPNSSTPVRVHGAFVRDEEVHAVVQDWKARGKPQYLDDILTAAEESEAGFSFDDGEELDPLFDQAVAFVVEKRKSSISGVQRQFRIGYNRAARIVEQMEAQGIVSPPGNNGNREVLAPPPHN